MLLANLLLVAGLVMGPPQSDSIAIPRGEMMRLFTDCDEARWPFGVDEQYVPKTTEEIEAGIARRRALEAAWLAYFAERGGGSIRPTPPEAWRYPLAVRGRLVRNFNNPRADGPHEALDVFVPREGVEVRTPAAGVVVAAGDGWRGGYERRGRGFYYEGEGLSRRAGNGAILFDPATGGYLLFSHLRDGVLVRPGDVVAAGTPIGRVGHTGNAALPGRGRHLHLAYKEAGTACGIPGVLVAVDPYRWVRAARDREFPAARATAPAAPAPRRPRSAAADRDRLSRT